MKSVVRFVCVCVWGGVYEREGRERQGEVLCVCVSVVCVCERERDRERQRSRVCAVGDGSYLICLSQPPAPLLPFRSVVASAPLSRRSSVPL